MILHMSKQVDRSISDYMSRIGRAGGKKSRRKLDSKMASRMALLREARRAYQKYHTQCFWSYDPDIQIGFEDISWVGEQLKKNGDRTLWLLGAKLCR